MIEGNKIKFGYGTIATGYSGGWRSLIYSHIKPPQKVGANLNQIIDKLELISKIYIPVEYDEACELKQLVLNTNEFNPIFEFKGYVFDFSNYNFKSKIAVIDSIDRLLSDFLYLLPYAC